MSGEEIMERVLQLAEQLKRVAEQLQQVKKQLADGIRRDNEIVEGMIELRRELNALTEESEAGDLN